jgi:hypothetical protein
MNAHVRDQLIALNAKPNNRTIINTNITLADSAHDIAVVTMTFQGGPVLIGWEGGRLLNSTGATQTPVFQGYVNTVAKGSAGRVGQNFDGTIATGNEHDIRPGTLLLLPADVPAGSQIVSLRETSNMGSGGSATLKGATIPFSFFVVEL